MFEDVSGVRDAKRMVRTIKIYVEEGKGNFAAIAEVVPLRIQKVAETVTLDDATIKAGEKVKLEVKHEEGTCQLLLYRLPVNPNLPIVLRMKRLQESIKMEWSLEWKPEQQRLQLRMRQG